MDERLWTFVFEIANFVALAAVLAWLFFKPVRTALEDQQAKVRRIEEDAARKLVDAQQVRDDVDSQRQALTSELEALRTKNRDAAKQEAEQIVAEAHAHAQRERAALKREALHIERAQTAKIARAVATVTHHAMTRFFQQLEGPELEQSLVKAACRELQASSNDSLAPVAIESASALDDAALEMINSVLGADAKTAVFRVVPELKGGLRISTAHGLIDASVAGLANYAEQSLSAEMESMIREESESE